jgi:hypothetical protein
LRTTRSTITFTAPFTLAGLGETHPAGTYELETDEEIIEGNAHTVYRRVATILFVRQTGMRRALTVDPKDLEDALVKDRARLA